MDRTANAICNNPAFGAEDHSLECWASQMMNNIPGMIYQSLYDPPNFTFTFVSGGCELLTGYTNKELIGDNPIKFLDMVHPDEKIIIENLIETTLSVGLPFDTTFRIVSKDGTEKRVLVRSRVIETDHKGFPSLIEGFYTDITKPLDVETTALANRAKSQFLAIMSHEIRTPMNAVLGMAELGLREDMPDKVREYTRAIKIAGTKLMSVLSNIWDFTQIEINELETVNIEYSLSALVNDVINLIAVQLDGTLVKFTVEIDNTIPDTLYGDDARLRQIILDVLNNAVKFTEKGFVSLFVGGDIIDNKLNLKIEVSDSGRGIKEEDTVNLFKEFTQFDTKTIEGTGLGLAIASNLLKLMGGEINVSSMYGVGSAFTITLPQKIHGYEKICTVNDPQDKNVLVFLNRADFVDTIANIMAAFDVCCKIVLNVSEFYDELNTGEFTHVFTASSLFNQFKKAHPDFQYDTKIVLVTTFEDRVTGNKYSSILTAPIYSIPVANILNDAQDIYNRYESNGMAKFTAPDARVLIVDDIRTNLKVAEGLLWPYKMILDFCVSGEEAIEAARTMQYDLILMDYLMPVMSGLEAAMSIRELDNCSNVPIVALTANAGAGARAMFLQNGFDDFLAKPIDTAMLNKIIYNWIPKEKHLSMSEESADIDNTDEFDIKIDGIDVEKSIAMIGGRPDIYLEILQTYHENSHKKLDELKDCMDRSDMELYRIHVHALKGASSSIGAINISKAAEKLEKIAENGDLALLQKNTPDFLVMLTKLLDNIYPFIVSDVDTQRVNMEILKSDLEKLKTAMVDLNLSKINEYTNNLQKYLLSADVGVAINEIIQNKMIGEYEEAVVLIDAILN